MATNIMLKAALYYHKEGLCVIPIVPRSKNPAIEWEWYQEHCSTGREINRWFGNGHQYNIGVVHGEVSGNFISIDIDHDSGIFDEMMIRFPHLFSGRVEQSGSGEGYHIPLRLRELPDFGIRKGVPRGNKTWKTPGGHINIRARHCQTVVPPSIHPTGNRYRFVQKGKLAVVDNLTDFIAWLDEVTPPKRQKSLYSAKRPIRPGNDDTLLNAVLKAWPDVMAVFDEFGLTSNIQTERNNELRILGHGGLLITEDRQQWFCFDDDIGGGIIQAWAWAKYGPNYDVNRNFRNLLLDMASVAGVDVAKYYRPGDEQKTMPAQAVDRYYWGRQFTGYWERVR